MIAVRDGLTGLERRPTHAREHGRQARVGAHLRSRSHRLVELRVDGRVGAGDERRERALVGVEPAIDVVATGALPLAEADAAPRSRLWRRSLRRRAITAIRMISRQAAMIARGITTPPVSLVSITGIVSVLS